jgi:hypothetical protein
MNIYKINRFGSITNGCTCKIVNEFIGNDGEPRYTVEILSIPDPTVLIRKGHGFGIPKKYVVLFEESTKITVVNSLDELLNL